MRKTLAGLTAVLVLATVGTASGGVVGVCDVGEDCPVDVTLAAVAGTRTMVVTTAAGADLNGGRLDLGTAHTGAFVVNVIDVTYDHVGYEVKGTLSDLYHITDLAAALGGGPGGYDCAATSKIASSKASMAYPIDPQLLDLGAILGGTVDLAGELTGAVLAALPAPIATLIGTLPLGGDELDLDGGSVPVSLEDLADGIEKVLDGASDLLPIKIGNGATGNYTNAAAHPKCGGGAGTPTSKLIMAGTKNDASGFLAALEGLLGDAVTLAGDAQGLIDDSVADTAAVEAAAVQAIQDLEDQINAIVDPDISLPKDDAALIAAVLDALGATLGAVFDVIGQTGTGVVVPTIGVDASDAPTSGLFGGRLTLTLMDVPD